MVLPPSEPVERSLEEECESLTWKIREKELQISRILNKTLFWHEQVDPALTESVARKEAYLTAWYERQKSYQRKLQLLKQVEEHLKKVKKELFHKETVMSRCYEQVGILALQSYQRSPAKWRVYENIFSSALSKLKTIAPKTCQDHNPIHFFLAGNFRQNPNLCRFLKKISRPVGERILQLNLLDFLRQQSLTSNLLSSAANHEQEYTTLLRKKRNLENNRHQLLQDLRSQNKWGTFFKSFFRRSTDVKQSPKLIMLELEQFYTGILKSYLDNKPEKIPANITKALEELEELKKQKQEVQKVMLKQKSHPNYLKYIKKSLAYEEQALQELYGRVKEQELKIRELKEKEKSLNDLLKNTEASNLKYLPV